jgi:hypothetical protein
VFGKKIRGIQMISKSGFIHRRLPRKLKKRMKKISGKTFMTALSNAFWVNFIAHAYNRLELGRRDYCGVWEMGRGGGKLAYMDALKMDMSRAKLSDDEPVMPLRGWKHQIDSLIGNGVEVFEPNFIFKSDQI